ncbi:hypothetical protein SAMN05518670_4148 [Paenibacillus sp. OK076]|nr:hypothetical protein SAMN05518670_4148 [Paenibacillus sp. OK076]
MDLFSCVNVVVCDFILHGLDHGLFYFFRKDAVTDIAICNIQDVLVELNKIRLHRYIEEGDI